MRITLPVEYSASVVPRGRRNAVTEYFMEWIEFDLPSADDLDAPVAATWRDEPLVNMVEEELFMYSVVRNYFTDLCVPADGHMHTRFINESHYWPDVRQTNHERQSPGVWHSVEDFVNEAAKEGSLYPIYRQVRLNYVPSEHPDGVPCRTEAYRKVEKLTRDQVIADIQKAISENCLAVDNMLYRKRGEPVYVKYALGHLPDHDWQYLIRVLPKSDAVIAKYKMLYSLDQWEEAIHDSRPEGGPTRETIDINKGRAATVHLEKALSADMTSEQMCREAESLVGDLKRRRLEDLKLNEVRSYIAISEAIKRFHETKNPEELYAAAKLYVESAVSGTYSNIYVQHANEIIRLHEFRAIPSVGVKL